MITQSHKQAEIASDLLPACLLSSCGSGRLFSLEGLVSKRPKKK